MKFWYKLGAKPRGRWNRHLEFGGQFTPEELGLQPNLTMQVGCALKRTSAPAQTSGAYWYTTRFDGASRLDEGRWMQDVGYFAPEDAADAIIFAIAVRDALLERIAQARAIEPEPEIAEEFDSDEPALPADAPVRRIRLVS